MSSRTGSSIVVAALVVASLSGCVGCAQKESVGSAQNETIRGLQEENKVVREQVGNLQKQVAELKAENEASKATMAKEFEDRLAKVRLLYEEKVKHLEGQISTLMLELGSVRQENIVLQELVDQRPRLQEASQVRFGIERTIWMVLLVLPLLVLIMIASKYHKLRSQLHLHVVQQASTLRQLESVK